MNSSSSVCAQINADSEEQLDIPSPGLVGHVQLFDFAETVMRNELIRMNEDLIVDMVSI